MIDPPALVVGWGLRIRSAIDLPGAMPLPPDRQAADLTIGFGPVPPAAPGERHGPYRLDPDGFTFVMPGVARYACTATAIRVDPDRGAPPADVAAMLIATAIPAVLWMRGGVVLHAAAAILPGTERAVAVLGRSGSGKSTLLARAIAIGARAIADDSLSLRFGPGGIHVSGLPGGRFAPLAAGAHDRLFHPTPPHRQAAEAVLGAMVILDDGASAGRLTGAAALGAVLAHRHRPHIARLLAIDGAALENIARLCRRVPVFTGPGVRPAGKP